MEDGRTPRSLANPISGVFLAEEELQSPGSAVFRDLVSNSDAGKGVALYPAVKRYRVPLKR